ncbi:hypothetical protein [Miltoncostaea oceani]|uniref:hypothetical protein n=1 Tax=Miltoncostaea oceani TaxID=2843216 RepID=UPI001C3E76DF|nr:hypothetical protein [Miltoncostaea oceani]
MSADPIRTLQLAASEGRSSLALDVAANGWTSVRLTGANETPLGADCFYDVVSRLMAAMSDPAQTTIDLGAANVSLVFTLPEGHCTVWVERHGGNAKTLHIQDHRAGVNIIGLIELDQEARLRWRAQLTELVAWAWQRKLPL